MNIPHWTEEIWIGFDTETTGVDPNTARILQAGIITDDPQGTLNEPSHLVYVDPGCEIPAEASAIHGITKEVLLREKAFDSQVGIIGIHTCVMARSAKRNYPLVIFNARYDWPLLKAECDRIPEFVRPSFGPLILDPCIIDRKLDKYRKGSRVLGEMAKFYGVKLDGAHDAIQDTKATLGIMRALIKKFPELKKYSIQEMQVLQRAWFEEWRDHINEYWKSIGKDQRVDGSWPE
jgi:DNA polymerase-3 subunit epsilon